MRLKSHPAGEVNNEAQRCSTGHDGVARLMATRSGGVPRLGCSSFKEQEVALAAKRLLEPPLALDVRMPPLHPKRSANIQALAAGHGSLFAGEAARAIVLVGMP